MSLQDHPVEELSLFLDDDLTEGRRAEIERHVAACPECARTLAELREVAAFARTLEARAPERDLWPGIEARLDGRIDVAGEPAGGRVLAMPKQRTGWGRQFSFTVPQLAAAGFLLVALSSAGVWVALRGIASSPSDPIAQAPQTASSATGSGTVAAGADFSTARYESAIRDLQAALAENRSKLDPETVKTVEQSLDVIDAAIASAQQALASDPSSPYLNGHLAEQMQRKISVLQQAAGFATADYSVNGS